MVFQIVTEGRPNERGEREENDVMGVKDVKDVIQMGKKEYMVYVQNCCMVCGSAPGSSKLGGWFDF